MAHVLGPRGQHDRRVGGGSGGRLLHLVTPRLTADGRLLGDGRRNGDDHADRLHRVLDADCAGDGARRHDDLIHRDNGRERRGDRLVHGGAGRLVQRRERPRRDVGDLHGDRAGTGGHHKSVIHFVE